MKLSVVIPAHNEEGCIAETITALYGCLSADGIPHEIIAVNDNSKDGTEKVVRGLCEGIPTLIYRDNDGLNGYGFAVREGLRSSSGDYIAIVMADFSDSPDDLVKYYRKAQEGFDCVFGSRWIKGATVVDYPFMKKIFNRLANTLVKLVFRIKYNDCTNAFKLYRRETIEGCRPFLSPHFNLTLELPLKAIVRGYSYEVIPCDWRNRKAGESKLKIKEMGSRYFFILLYCLIEKYFSRGDFHKSVKQQHEGPQPAGVPTKIELT
jgi:dolichol-phosphate mannosyltransferase